MPKPQRPEIIALAVLVVALIVAAASLLRLRRPAEPITVTTALAATMISVHVVGEVLWPGLYVLKAGARVQDAVFAAHGPTLIADLKRVNLAAVLRDGDRVVIPRIAQPPYPYTEAQLLALSQKAGRPPPGSGEAAPAGAGPPALSGASNARAGEAAVAVNVNTATAADLERLPGGRARPGAPDRGVPRNEGPVSSTGRPARRRGDWAQALSPARALAAAGVGNPEGPAAVPSSEGAGRPQVQRGRTPSTRAAGQFRGRSGQLRTPSDSLRPACVRHCLSDDGERGRCPGLGAGGVCPRLAGMAPR